MWITLWTPLTHEDALKYDFKDAKCDVKWERSVLFTYCTCEKAFIGITVPKQGTKRNLMPCLVLLLHGCEAGKQLDQFAGMDNRTDTPQVFS